MDKEYYASERFIHDELQRRAAQSVAKIPDLWRDAKRIFPTLLLWPTDAVPTTAGDKFSGVVLVELPDSLADRLSAVRKATKDCGAYAVLVVEEVGDAVRAIFETQHGTETWRLPIKDHGGVRVLGAAVKRSNVESIGVLWKAN